MVTSSSAGFLSSMTPRGNPFTNSTTSGLRVFRFSMTVNGLTASQSLAAESPKSITRTSSPRMAPSTARYSTVTPLAGIRWNARLRASRVEPWGRVSLRKASPSADGGRGPIQRRCPAVVALGVVRVGHRPRVSAWPAP